MNWIRHWFAAWTQEDCLTVLSFVVIIVASGCFGRALGEHLRRKL